jgi:hypothetical protein
MWSSPSERDGSPSRPDISPHDLCHTSATRLVLEEAVDLVTVAALMGLRGNQAGGQDIHALVTSTLAWREVDAAQAQELDQIAFDGYLEGLRDAGWRGDPRHVRFGQTARSVMRGIPGLALGLAL